METVLPYHAGRFTKVVETCRGAPSKVCVQELVFATRFITTFLFLKVKCTRPMSYQYLTLEMLEKAKKNGGYIDQTDFKTQDTYTFDTIIIDEDVMKILGLYVQYCRPMLSPKCDYLLLTTTGNMCQNLCHSMSLLVHEAIGKYIHPTRYRQIVETESAGRLNAEEREAISKDQKHSSQVAKVFYQKLSSRDVALKGKECMEKLAAPGRSRVNDSLNELANYIENIENTLDVNTIERTREILQDTGNMPAHPPAYNTPTQSSDHFRNTAESPKEQSGADIIICKEVAPTAPPSRDVKEEEMEVRTQRTRIHFTKEEDQYLRKGLEKYGRGSWATILNDADFTFHPSRNRNTLRIRADTAGFKVQHNM